MRVLLRVAAALLIAIPAFLVLVIVFALAWKAPRVAHRSKSRLASERTSVAPTRAHQAVRV
jgi:hypothetical protein